MSKNIYYILDIDSSNIPVLW